MCRAGGGQPSLFLTLNPQPYTLNPQPRACSHQNNLLNLHNLREANKKLAPASYSTPIGATFRIAPHLVGSYIFSKSCKLSLSKSRLTPDLARKRHSYTPQLRSIYPDKCTLNTQIFTELFIARGICALLSVHSVCSVCNKAQLVLQNFLEAFGIVCRLCEIIL